MAILLLVGEAWVRRSGRSPDWWDSWVIMLWVRTGFAPPGYLANGVFLPFISNAS